MRKFLKFQYCLIFALVLLITALLVGGCGSGTSSNTAVSASEAKNNHPPVIETVLLEYTSIARGGTGHIKAIASDPDGDKLTYKWEVNRGSISGKGAEVTYTAPNSFVEVNLTLTVADGKGGVAIYPVSFSVVCCGYAQKNPDWTP